MSNIMFKIGTTDYSSNVVAKNYKVGSYPEYELWTDANGKEHRSKYRSRIRGSLDLFFFNITEYQTFVTLLNNQIASDLTYSIIVYDCIAEAEATITAFIDYDPSRYRGADEADMVGQITLNIREQ